MFRHDKIIVAGGMFVASFFSMAGCIFAKEPDESYSNPYFKLLNTNSRGRTDPKYRLINNCASYSKQRLITLLKNGIREEVDYRGRVPLALFREKVEGFCECVLKDVHASLCGIVSKYLQDVECGGFNVSYTSAFLMLERGYKHGLSHSIHQVPEVSYVGLSEDCYRDEELPSFFKQDARILTDFLLKQVLPDYGGTVEDLRKRVAIVGRGSAFLDEAVSSAFKERKITLKVFSHFLESGTMKNMEESNNEFFLRLKNILEGGKIFQGEFISIFWKTFVKRSYAFDLFNFFGNYVPVSEIDMTYGLTAFRFFAKQKTFENLFDDELLAIINEINGIFPKRLIMALTVLKQSPEAKKKDVMDFFLRMNDRLGETQKAAKKELEKYSDPWYWKIEPCFNNEEEKKIFDELNESEEQVKDDGCELKKRTSKVTSKPISTQRVVSQMPMPAPGLKINMGYQETVSGGVYLVPEVSLKYEF